MATGRPSIYTDAIADEICERIAEGESLRTICLDDRMPGKATVFRWLGENPRFRDQYTLARDAQADVLVDEIIDIADDSASDKYIDDEGRERVNSEVVNRSRLRVDARKWVASKLLPKKYGERQQLAHTDADGGAVRVEYTWADRQPDES